jgi:hypothetical protein
MKEKSASMNLELVTKSGLRISVRNLTAEKENQQRLNLAKAKTETIASIPEQARIEHQRAAAAAAEIGELEGLARLYQGQMDMLKGRSRDLAAQKLAKVRSDLTNAQWHIRAREAVGPGNFQNPEGAGNVTLNRGPARRIVASTPVRFSSILTRIWING